MYAQNYIRGKIICLVDFMPIFNVSSDKRVSDSFLGRLLPKLILLLSFMFAKAISHGLTGLFATQHRC